MRTVCQKKNAQGTRIPSLGQRHVVAIFGFIICSLLNVHRLVMAVAIVAMVKNKQNTGNPNLNASKLSCPLMSTSQNTTDFVSEGEYDWSSELQGYVLGAGFLGYVITHFPGGIWAESWGAKRLIFTGNFLAAIFTSISPMASWWNVYALIAVQFLRGLSQGVFIPAVFVLMANWFPRNERGYLATFVVSGFAIGGTVGGLVTGWLCDLPQVGWQGAFYAGGIYSAIISIAFAITIYENPQNHPRITLEELKYITEGQECDLSKKRPPTPWCKMFTSVPVYALIFGLYGQYWSVAYFLSVHPTYMGTILNFPISENGAASSIPVSLKCVGGLIACFFTNWATKNNYIGVNKLRKVCNSVGAFGFSFCLLCAYWARCDYVINVACFSLSLFCSGIALSGAMITSGDMSPQFSGSLMGISSAVSSTSTFIIPVIAGSLTKDQTIEEWHSVFFISIATVLICGLIFIVFGSADVQSWNYPEPQDLVNAASDVTKTKNEEPSPTKTEDLKT